jgi:thiamine pyrophosphate-dependent acetolactate synthase large subunit-like protein
MTGGRAVIEALKANGCDAVFGIPGVHNIHIYDALIDGGLDHYVTRHEQGAGFMADGYARASGRPGVALPITGPGLTNISTPVGQAWTDSSPLLVVSSQIESTVCDREKGTLHELRDQMGFMSHITEWNVRAKDPQDVARQINRAYSWMRNRRPRPVHVEVPIDVQEAEAEVDLTVEQEFSPLAPVAGDIEEAIKMIAGAKRVVIYAGGGAHTSGAGKAILALAERLGAPVLVTTQGKGVVPEDDPRVLGNVLADAPVQELLATCDLTIAIGTHFGASNTASWKYKMPGKLLHIDIDSREFNRNYHATLAVKADARLALLALLSGLDSKKRAPYADYAALKEQIVAGFVKNSPWEHEHTKIMRDELGRDGVMVCDMTSICYPATRFYSVYEPRTFQFPRGFGTLGFSPPTAIGAKIACPGKNVMAVVGDGGFMFTCAEVATAMKYNVPVVMVIVNSQSYHVVKRNQVQRFGPKRTIDVDVTNPDFGKFAASFGTWYRLAKDANEFRNALHAAFAAGEPAIVEVPFNER